MGTTASLGASLSMASMQSAFMAMPMLTAMRNAPPMRLNESSLRPTVRPVGPQLLGAEGHVRPASGDTVIHAHVVRQHDTDAACVLDVENAGVPVVIVLVVGKQADEPLPGPQREEEGAGVALLCAPEPLVGEVLADIDDLPGQAIPLARPEVEGEGTLVARL